MSACTEIPSVEVEIHGAFSDPVPASYIGKTESTPSAIVESLPLTSEVARPPQDLAALTELIRRVRADSLEDIDGAARNLARAGPSTWPHIRNALLADRRHPKGDYRRLLSVIGGDVPNRYGHFKLHWKRQHGHKVRVSDDWFEDLLVLPSTRVSGALRDVYRDLILQTALLRAAGAIGHQSPTLRDEVVQTLLDVAYLHRGTFRDEVGRTIQTVGNSAIPMLLRSSLVPSHRERDADTLPVKRAKYAVYNLDRLDRLHPQRAIQATRDDPQLCAEIVAAYGELRPGEAAPVLIDLLDDAVPSIRRAARDSLMAYVTGPIPKTRRKTLRTLGGGIKTASAHLSYRAMASISIRSFLAEHHADLLEDECRVYRADGSVDPRCEFQPKRLVLAYLGRLDNNRRNARDGLIAQAVSMPDKEAAAQLLDVLLTSGEPPHDPAMLAGFFEQAAAQADSRKDRIRSAQLLRKSAMLLASTSPERAKEVRSAALLREAEAPGVGRQGRAMLLESAIRLNPESQTIHAALQAASLDLDDPTITNAADKNLYRGIPLLLLVLGSLWVLGVQFRKPSVV